MNTTTPTAFNYELHEHPGYKTLCDAASAREAVAMATLLDPSEIRFVGSGPGVEWYATPSGRRFLVRRRAQAALVNSDQAQR